MGTARGNCEPPETACFAPPTWLLRRLLCFLLIAAVQWPAHSEPPRPFLTTATETRDERDTRELRPTKQGIEKPFYDLNYAVNVPFEVRYEGGNVWVLWQANVYWDDPPAEWKQRRPPEGLRETNVVSTGIYRLDGGALPQNAVLKHDGTPYKWDATAPVPTFVTRPSSSIRPARGPHKLFASEDWRYAQLRPAQPGWYSLWFGMDGDEHLWPKLEPPRTRLSGRYRVDIVVARGERPPDKEVVKFLFGQGDRPKGMLDDKLYTASSSEVPFELRADGWVFDRVEVRPWSESLKQRRTEQSSG